MIALTEAGLIIDTATEIKEDLDDAFKAGPLGESAGSDGGGGIPAASSAGQEIAILTDAISSLEEALEDLVASFDPTQASGQSLDNLCALTGTTRNPAIHSNVTGTCCGTPSTLLPVQRVALVDTSASRFLTSEDNTIAALDAWLSSHGYIVGDRVTNASRCYQCIDPGTSAGSGGPTTQSTDITDGGVHWTWLGEGTGAVDAVFEAEDEGAIAAAVRTLGTIATPVSGWQSVTNLLIADVGRAEELDSALRVRREAELGRPGKATADAIRSDVLDVNGVTSCVVFYNDSDSTSADGLPPHSVEVIVLGGDDDEIAEAVFGVVAAGIYTHGTTVETVTDDGGQTQTVRFTRPDQITIWIIVNVTVDANTFPADGEDQLRIAIVALGDEDGLLPVGRNVTAWAVGATLDEVAGVLDATSILIGLSDPPVASTTIAIGIREVASIDSSRIEINTTPGTP